MIESHWQHQTYCWNAVNQFVGGQSTRLFETSCQMENRIREHRERAGLSLEDLAEKIGTTNQQLSMLERGKRGLTLKWMDRIARPLGLNPSDLLPIQTTHHRIPLAGQVQAGKWVSPDAADEFEQESFDLPLPDTYSHCKPFALRVVGQSMNLIYPEGTILICCQIEKLQEDPIPGKRYIIEDVNPAGDVETTVKELVIDNQGRPWAWPRSSHPEHQTPAALDDGREGHTIRVAARVVYSMKPE